MTTAARTNRRTEGFGRTSLREQVRDLLLDRIVAGEYPPGSRLVETRIAEELGVSQAPVREALRDLEQLSCVVHTPFRGCSVRGLSADDLLEAYPVRGALEGLAARLAASRISSDQLDVLAQQVDAMRAATRSADVAAESAADATFHATIIEAAANSVLSRQWHQLQPFARTFISLALPNSEHGDLADRHLPILDALRSHDAAAAEAAMHEHLADVAQRMRLLKRNPNEEKTS